MVVHEVAHVVHPVDDIWIDQTRIERVPLRLWVAPGAGVGTTACSVCLGVHWVVFQRAREVDGRHGAKGVSTRTAVERLRRVAAVGVAAPQVHVGGLLGVPVVLRGTVLNILGATEVVSVGKLTGRHSGRHAVSVV